MTRNPIISTIAALVLTGLLSAIGLGQTSLNSNGEINGNESIVGTPTEAGPTRLASGPRLG